MKFFEIDEEYLKKGGLITREAYESGLSFGLYNNCLVAYHYGKIILPLVKLVGYINDLLENDWKYVEYNKTWKPESGDTIYYVSSTGHVYEDTFCAISNCDNDKVSFNNVFKTKEDAKKMLEKLKIINRLRELSNVKFVDDCSKLRYSVSYDVDTKKVCPTMNRFSRILPFELYFETAQDCQKAINEIGEENIKKYYFDVVD
jgi:hypothetical protein